MSKKPVLLCIMDGFGWVPNETYGNAVVAAKTPHLDALMEKYPMTTIDASGMAVGLPDGQMGNSEVGHTNMGAGRIVYQQLTLITKSIRDGEMFKNPVLVKNMKAAIEAGKAIHLMGLVGTGGVHSHADHWFGVLEMAKHMGAKEVYLHCITDGRDTDPHAGKGFLADLQAKLDELGVGKIASVSGRYYAMDRDNNWDREEKAYAAFVYGEGNHAANAAEAIEASYAADKTDEFVLPCVTCEGGRVQDGDTVIFMNFRPDRARQMTRIFCDDDFKGFERRGGRKQVNYVCMAEYDATMPNCEVAYPPVELKNVLGQYLSENGKTQLRIAETEKYAHVTFFFNGGVEQPCEGEDRKVIPSPKVATYDLKPEMSAYEVADECKARIESGKAALKLEPSDINELAASLKAVFDPLADEKHITTTCTIDIQHPYVRSDQTKVREIILNIISNAIKYTPEGGRVDFTMTELPGETPGTVRYKAVVQDDGIGMSAEYLPHLFEEFSREHTSTESRVTGTGLGLPIVKSLVQLMGGTIDVESTVGKGSTFTVVIPFPVISKEELTQQREQPADPSAGLAGKHLLLAEDNDLNAEIALTILQENGMIVNRAEDGIRCLELLGAKPAGYYDAVLMDIQMPRMDGYQAAQAIRALPDARSTVPIIAMTANAFEEDKQRAFDAGMNDHISKPISVNTLLAALRKNLK